MVHNRIRFYHYKQFRDLQMSSKTSSGNRITTEETNARIKIAKAQKLFEIELEYGYHFCEDCRTNSGRIDLSHTIGIGKAKQDGMTELCWDVSNIKLRCRDCHNKLDRLY